MKHRLTGAAVLIGFAVVVLPLLLGGPENTRNGRTAEGMARETDTKVFRSNITPIAGETPTLQAPDDDGGGASASSAGAEEAASGEASVDAPEEPESGTTASAAESGGDNEPAAKEAEARNEQQDEPANTIERGWIVQVGTFKNPDNVDKLKARLENDGFGTSTTEVETSEGMATRVWVGPFETRVEAARTKTRVKQRIGSEGLIVAYP